MALVNPNSPSEQFFREQMARLFGNWPVHDESTRKAKADEFREVYGLIGNQRFALAVRDTIWNYKSEFFPPLAIFEQFIPAPPKRDTQWEHSEEEWARIRRERETPEFKEAWAKLKKTIEMAERKSGEMFRKVAE